MKKSILVGVCLFMFGSVGHAQVSCLNIDTFPTVQVPITQGTLTPTAPVPKCVATCQTVRPPRCTDSDVIFEPVSPKNLKDIGNYDSVSCTDISTFPTRTRPEGTFPKCVLKCQTVRPPQCVDYNKELY